jgi:hypothetical protein
MPTSNPVVTVLEIIPNNIQALIDMGFDLKSFLDKEMETKENIPLNQFLAAYAERSTSVFFLCWKGNKVPRGAVIRGQVVAWTQNGSVVAESGALIGTYERLVEFGPGDEQQMLVYYIGGRKK